jgi:hypothetical protein
VTNVRRQQTTDGAELLVSLKLTREGAADARSTVPITFDIEGARSELTVEMIGPTFELKDHRIPVDKAKDRGWGKVSIPADANPADNEFYFVFDKPLPRKTVIVSGEPQAVAALQLAASIPPDPGIGCNSEVVGREQLAAVEWDTVALLVWHAPLPDGDAAAIVETFVQRGGQVVFLPPRSPGDAAGRRGWTSRRRRWSRRGGAIRTSSPTRRVGPPYRSAGCSSAGPAG